MIQATAQGYKTLPDGTPVSAPVALQLAWLCERWGTAGMNIDFQTRVKMDRALGVYRAFKKDIKDRGEEDWRIINDALAIIEGQDA